MYNDAFAREQTVRAAMTAADLPQSTVQDVRATIAAYEAVVKRYPASGYCDNALWQAAHLALDAFDTFGQAQDRDNGVRLLRRLASMYPTSKLARRVPIELARVGDEPGDPRVSVRDKSIATIRDIRRAVLPDAVRVTIELDSEVAFHEERLADPVRVFVDLPATKAAPALIDRTLRFEADADVVRQVRVGRHPNNTTRVVLEAAGVGSYSVYSAAWPKGDGRMAAQSADDLIAAWRAARRCASLRDANG